MKRILLASCLSLVACGGGAAQSAAVQPTQAAQPADDHGHDFPANVTAFHDRLKPLWHAEAGAGRTDDTCAAAGDLVGAAGPMRDDAPPAEDKRQAYGDAVGALETAIGELQAACGAEGRPDFEAAFTKVHEAFHGVVGFFGHAEHEEHK